MIKEQIAKLSKIKYLELNKRNNSNSVSCNKTRACRLKSGVAGFFVYYKSISDSTN